GGGVIASLLLGRLYDRWGLPVVLTAVLLSAPFAPLVFLGDFGPAVIGMFLWGVGYATQVTLFKALIASVLPVVLRSSGFSLFYGGYGLGWLVGSVTVGLLYQSSRFAVVCFSVAAQLAAIPVFVVAGRLGGYRSSQR